MFLLLVTKSGGSFFRFSSCDGYEGANGAAREFSTTLPPLLRAYTTSLTSSQEDQPFPPHPSFRLHPLPSSLLFTQFLPSNNHNRPPLRLRRNQILDLDQRRTKTHLC
jgi:hypothetical protein